MSLEDRLLMLLYRVCTTRPQILKTGEESRADKPLGDPPIWRYDYRWVIETAKTRPPMVMGSAKGHSQSDYLSIINDFEVGHYPNEFVGLRRVIDA